MCRYRPWFGWTGALVLAVVLGALLAAAPASALTDHRYNDKRESFSGGGCGSTSQVAVWVPRGARNVSASEPRLGTVMHDDTTGAPVARITSIQPTQDGAGNPGVAFTATGSDDTCANPDTYADFGWQTYGVYFRVDYTMQVHVLYPSHCSDPSYRPRTIVVACGDGNFYVNRIHWRRWTDGGAYGVGIGHANDCQPYCAAGHFRAYPGLVVRLGGTRYCPDHDDYEFTRLGYRFTHHSPPGLLRSGSGLPGCASP